MLRRPRELKAEVFFGVGKADIANHSADQSFVVWQVALFNFGAAQIAKDAAKILMARKGHEGARVGDHADEASEKAVVRKSVELRFDALFLVEKPPRTAELNFSGKVAVLEITDCGS